MKNIKLLISNMNIKNENIFRLMVLLSIIFLSSFIKISFLSGSYKFFFSGINFVLPLVGNLFGVATSGLIVFAFLLFKKFTIGGAITLGIPTVIATVYISLMSNYKNNFKNKLYNFLLSFILPLFCMTLFIFHPMGNKAYIYSFYWLIPVVLYIAQRFKNFNIVYLNYLTATFLAHAVGSIIWLYTMPMTVEQWIGLMPVVFVERIIFAFGVYIIYCILKKLCILELNKIKFFKTIKNI
ncbi:hypothetical protein KJ644_02380 [Candidatus Dependentiae bacterium]|nr:hypothetical protein [Candidatus Dependentiae bacterium]MBU4387300.1 hypothetical protein [Candidatus Dependentiae bacterium]MCG2756442.1 hypothetical protein [Candidatus Dependentiae bacterium]